MTTGAAHRFGLLKIGFELISDWDELTEYFKSYTSFFEHKGDPSYRYTVFSREKKPVLRRTGHDPIALQRVIDLYPLLEDAFLSDLVSGLGASYPIYHAAVVAKNGQASIYLGEANAGKSTLCVEKVRDGYIYLSDEMAAVDGDEVIAIPRPISFNDLENPAELLPLGDELFKMLEYDFVDKEGRARCSRQFLPREGLVAKAGERFAIKDIVFLESVEDGPPVHHELEGAEMRARLALSQFPV